MMVKDITFRTALAVSISLHLLALTPWNAFHFGKTEDKKLDIEVTYILERLEEFPEDKVLKTLPQKYDLEKKKTELPSRKKPAREIAKETVEAKTPQKEEQYIDEKEIEKLEEYIAYHELIREKIKSRVTRYYKRFAKEGRVDAIFTLRNNGALKNLSIAGVEERETKRLAEIARKSIKQASPFPPFPDALKKDELTFTIAIIFKKQ